MEYLDADAIFEFGLALGRLGGETVDEHAFRTWVDRVIEVIERDEAEFASENGSRNCRVVISSGCGWPATEGIGSNMFYLRQAPADDSLPPTGARCYDIGHCRLCILWLCEDRVSLE